MRDDLLKELQHRQKDISNKIERLKVNNVDDARRSVEDLKQELDKLVPLMVELSPENSKKKKKPKLVTPSELEKKVYTKEKLVHANEIIEKIKMQQIEDHAKLQRKLEAAEMKSKIEQEMLERVHPHSISSPFLEYRRQPRKTKTSS